MEAAAKAVNVAAGKEELEMANAALEAALGAFQKHDAVGAKEASSVAEETAIVSHVHSVYGDESSPEMRTLRLEQEVLHLKLQLLEQRFGGGVSRTFEDGYGHDYEGSYSSRGRSRGHQRSSAVGMAVSQEETDESASPDASGNTEELPDDGLGTIPAKESEEAIASMPRKPSTAMEKQMPDTQGNQADMPADVEYATKPGEDLRSYNDNNDYTDVQGVPSEPEEEINASVQSRPKNGYRSGDDEGLEISEERAIGEADDIEEESQPIAVAEELMTQDANTSTDEDEESQAAAAAAAAAGKEAPPEPEIILPDLFDPPRAPPEDVP